MTREEQALALELEIEIMEMEKAKALANSGNAPIEQTQQPAQRLIPSNIMGQPGQFEQALEQARQAPQTQQDPRYPNLAKSGRLETAMAPLTIYSNALPIAIDRMAGYKDSQITDPNVFSEFAKPISEPMAKAGRKVFEATSEGARMTLPPDMQNVNPEEFKQARGNIGEGVGRFAGEMVASIPDPALLASGGLSMASKGYGMARPAIREGVAVTREMAGKPFKKLSDAITQSDVRFLSKDLKAGAKVETLKKYGIHGASEDAEEILDSKINELAGKQKQILTTAGKQEPIVDLNAILDDSFNKTFAKGGKLGREAKADAATQAIYNSIKSSIEQKGGLVPLTDAQSIKSAWGDEAAFAAVGQKMGTDPNATITKELYTNAYVALRDHIEKAVQEAYKSPLARRELHEINQDIHSLIAVKNAVKYRNGVKARQNVLPSRNVLAGGVGGIVAGVKGAIVGSAVDAAFKSPATARLLNWMSKRIQGKGVAEREQLFDVLRKKGIPESDIKELRAYYQRSGRTGDFEGTESREALPERQWGKTGQRLEPERPTQAPEAPIEQPKIYPEKNNVKPFLDELSAMKSKRKDKFPWELELDKKLGILQRNLYGGNLMDVKGNISHEEFKNLIEEVEYMAGRIPDKKVRENLLMAVEKGKKYYEVPAVESGPKHNLPATRQGISFNAMQDEKPRRLNQPLKVGTISDMIRQTGKLKWNDNTQNLLGLTFEDAKVQWPGLFSKTEGGDFRNAAERLNESFGREIGKQWDEGDIADELTDNKDYSVKAEDDTRFDPNAQLEQTTDKDIPWDNQFQIGLTRQPTRTKITTEDEIDPNLPFDLPNGPLKNTTAMETRWKMRDTFAPERNKLEQVELAGVPEGKLDNPKVIEHAKKQWEEKGTDSPYFKRWFGDSKVVDKDGKPLVVYHGTTKSFDEFSNKFLGQKTNAKSAKGGHFFSSDPETANYYAKVFSNEIIPQKYIKGQLGGVFDVYKKNTPKEYFDIANKFGEASEKYELPFDDAIIKNSNGENELNKETAIRNINKLSPRLAVEISKGTPLYEASNKILGTKLWPTSETHAYYLIKEKLKNTYSNIYASSEIGQNPQVYKTYIAIKNPLIIDVGNKSFDEVISKKINMAITKAKKDGKDGVIIKNLSDGGPVSDHYVVFDPTQIKSAIGNRGTFDPNDANILRQEQLYSTTKGTTAKTDKGTRMEFGDQANIATAIHEGEHSADFLNRIPERDRMAFQKAMGLKEWNTEAMEKFAYGVEYLAREGKLPAEFPRALQSRLQRIAEKEYGPNLKADWERQYKDNPTEGNRLAIEGQKTMWEGMPPEAEKALQSALKRGVTERRLKTLANAIKKANKPAAIARIVSQINREYKE